MRQHAQTIGVDPEKPRATATVDDLAFFVLAAVFFFGLSALVYWSLGCSSLLANAGGSLHAAAEGLGGAVLIAQPVAVWSHWRSGTSRACLDTRRYPCGRW